MSVHFNKKVDLFSKGPYNIIEREYIWSPSPKSVKVPQIELKNGQEFKVQKTKEIFLFQKRNIQGIRKHIQ